MKFFHPLLLLPLCSPSGASASEPTEYEQYALELVNRARANPTAEVDRLAAEAVANPGFWAGPTSYRGFAGTPSLNEGSPSINGVRFTIPDAPSQPLAFNPIITGVTDDYVNVLQQNNSFAHGLGGLSSQQRMALAGYNTDFALSTFSGGFVTGWENNGFATTSVSYDTPNYQGDARKEAMDLIHHFLFADNGIAGRGHRITMLAADWREAGIGISFGRDGNNFSVYLNQNFGHLTGSDPIVTGVVYSDLDEDGFYTPAIGEPHGDIKVTAIDPASGAEISSASTTESGGYAMKVPGNATYDIQFSNAEFDFVVAGVEVGAQNVKIDAVDPAEQDLALAPEMQLSRPDIGVADSDVVITWQGTKGVSYRIATSSDFKIWEPLEASETAATELDEVLSFRHSKVIEAGRGLFYRVEVVEE